MSTCVISTCAICDCDLTMLRDFLKALDKTTARRAVPSPLLVGPAGKRPSLATCVAVCVKVCYDMYLAYVIV